MSAAGGSAAYVWDTTCAAQVGDTIYMGCVRTRVFSSSDERRSVLHGMIISSSEKQGLNRREKFVLLLDGTCRSI
eukprot:467398-Pelagomonas_calceolata.AAC.2